MRFKQITEARATAAERLLDAVKEYRLDRHPVRLALHAEDDDEISVQKLSVHDDHLRQGYARERMTELCQLADQFKVTLYLEALPDDDAEIAQEDLMRFYRSLGFEGKTAMMYRPPQKKRRSRKPLR